MQSAGGEICFAKDIKQKLKSEEFQARKSSNEKNGVFQN